VIRVKAGTTVTWHNDDNFTHSVFVNGSNDQPKVAQPGESVQLTFDKPGEYNYICTFHPNDMKGKVIVTGASSATALGD
jgi:plastocyanin